MNSSIVFALLIVVVVVGIAMYVQSNRSARKSRRAPLASHRANQVNRGQGSEAER